MRSVRGGLAKGLYDFFVSAMWLYALLMVMFTLTEFAHGEPVAVTLNATVEYLGPSEVLTLWQLPAEGRVVRKLLVIFCPKTTPGEDPLLGPYSFWDTSPGCPLCAGLPESRKIVIDALSRDYAVIVPTVLGFPDRYWSDDAAWPPDSPDIEYGFMAISEWKRQHGLEDVPNVGIGMSAGGDGLSTFALRLGFFDSITVMISGGMAKAFEAATGLYPPTLFVSMPKDEMTLGRVSSAISVLRSKGVETKLEAWYEHPITPDWFSTLIPEINSSSSETMFSAFKDYGFLDENNFLICAPRVCDWVSFFASVGKKLIPEMGEWEQKLYESHVDQELNVAFAYHVTLSRKNDEIFAWYEGHGKSVSESKIYQYETLNVDSFSS